LLTRSAAPLFMQYKKLVDLLFLDMISLHKSLSKLEYVLVNVLNTLLLRGFCKQEETTEGEGEGEGEITELQEGTGLGDGKGQK
jgi:midasin (ATPase involved in ribosome maturation)